MSYQISNQELSEKIKEAEMAEGYFITISRLNNGRLSHYYQTRTFPRNDIPISLEHYKKILKTEMAASVSGESGVVEKTLPPEYRKDNQE